jgi:integral membrane protein
VTNKARQLAAVSVLETLSFIALLAVMVMGSEAGISAVGMVHGLLFLAYAVLVFRDHRDLGWTTGFMLVAILTGPVGAIVVLERLRRDGALGSARA